MRVQFKFDEASPRRERERVIDAITQQGAERVKPLFARETDPELASLFTAEASETIDPKRLVSALERSDAVEFAEVEPRRKALRRR